MRVSFADKARQVAPYVTFRINKRVTASQRKRVNAYHRILYGYSYRDEHHKTHYENGLATGLKVQVLPRKRGPSLGDLQDLSGTPRHKYLKGAWFDTVQGKSGKLLKPRIGKSRKGELYYEVDHVRFGFIPFNKRKLARDADSELDRVLGNNPNDKRFLIKCGKAQSKNQESRSTVKAKVIDWQQRYKNSGEWLLGLVPITFTRQKSFRQYRAHREKTLKARKGRRK